MKDDTHLNAGTLISGEDFQGRSPRPLCNGIVPNASGEAFVAFLQGRLELQLLLVLRSNDLDIRERVREVHGGAEDAVVDLSKRRVLVTVKVLERRASRLEHKEVGQP